MWWCFSRVTMSHKGRAMWLLKRRYNKAPDRTASSALLWITPENMAQNMVQYSSILGSWIFTHWVCHIDSHFQSIGERGLVIAYPGVRNVVDVSLLQACDVTMLELQALGWMGWLMISSWIINSTQYIGDQLAIQWRDPYNQPVWWNETSGFWTLLKCSTS